MRVVHSALFLCLAVGCGRGGESGDSAQPARVFSEHRTLVAEKATKLLGDDCTANGKSACQSGLCLHTKAAKDRGYICSSTCSKAADCPPGWSCVQTYPSADGQFCVPPESAADAGTKPLEVVP